MLESGVLPAHLRGGTPDGDAAGPKDDGATAGKGDASKSEVPDGVYLARDADHYDLALAHPQEKAELHLEQLKGLYALARLDQTTSFSEECHGMRYTTNSLFFQDASVSEQIVLRATPETMAGVPELQVPVAAQPVHFRQHRRGQRVSRRAGQRARAAGSTAARSGGAHGRSAHADQPAHTAAGASRPAHARNG